MRKGIHGSSVRHKQCLFICMYPSNQVKCWFAHRGTGKDVVLGYQILECGQGTRV